MLLGWAGWSSSAIKAAAASVCTQGLADGDHVRPRPHRLEEGDEVLDIFVEAEAAVPDADIARIGPVGDVHVVLGQQHAHRVAQQGGEVAGERRHQQHPRLRGAAFLDETQQAAEGGGEDLLLAHRHGAVAALDLADAEGRPTVAEGGPAQHLAQRAGCPPALVKRIKH
jgi:hypothetical protein